jgi:hypothetical protein
MDNLGYFLRLGMLYLIGLHVLLPIFNSRSVELNPEHTHIVIGAKNEQEAEQILLAHLLGSDLQHDDHSSSASGFPSATGFHSGAQVISLATPLGGPVVGVGFDTQAWALANRMPLIMPQYCLWQTLSFSSIFPAGNLLLPQTPPPESAF